MTTATAPVLKREYSRLASQQSEEDGYLCIALRMRHCLMCNRETPYFIAFDNPYLKRLWVCWEHMGKKYSQDLRNFYEEEEQAISQKLIEEHRNGLR